MEEICDKIGENVKILDINDEARYKKCLEASVFTIADVATKSSYVPFITFMTCHCGCGKIIHVANDLILSKQQLVKFLRSAADIAEKELKNLN